MGSCPENTFRVFDRTDYYTIHGPNAESIAKSFFGTTSAIKYIGSDSSQKIASIAISQSRYESLLRHILIENKYRLELYKKTSNKKSSNEWELDFKASPGCLGPLEDIIYSTNVSIDSRGVCAVQYSIDFKIGIAFVDSITNEMSFCEFEDNNYLSLLESLLVQISPKECLIPIKDKTESEVSKKLSKLLDSNRILVTEVKKNCFNSSNLDSDLKKLVVKKVDKEITLNSESIVISFDINLNYSSKAMLEKKRLSRESLSAVLDYLNLIGDNSNFESFSFTEINLTKCVKLDATAVQSLDLFPNNINDCNTKTNGTLFQVLNKCRTLSGQRLLAQMIRQPLTDINKIGINFLNSIN